MCVSRKERRDCRRSYWDAEDITGSSRLASQITLTRELDGIQIFIPDGIPTEGAF